MKANTKALTIACAIETVLLALLVTSVLSKGPDGALIADILSGYHFIAFFVTLLLFARLRILPGEDTLTTIVEFAVIFAVQVALTYPIVFFLQRRLGRRADGRIADQTQRTE